MTPSAATWLVRATLIAAYGNWLLTVIKAFLKVQGIDYVGQTANDAMFGALTLVVVIPTVAAAWIWTRGLFRGLGSASAP